MRYVPQRPAIMSVNPLKSVDCNPAISLYVPESADLTRAKSGRGMAGGKEPQQFPKTDFRHWERKVFRHSYMEDAVRVLAKTYSVRIAYRGLRHSFPLGLSNLRESAKKARDIYMMAITKGWEETLAHFKPDYSPPEPEAEAMTVGKYITLVSPVSEARSRTVHGYAVALRRIAAGICGLEGESRPERGKEAVTAWRAAVDAIPLADLTREKVMAWKQSYVARAGADPVARGRCEVTSNSLLRQAKALFSQKKILDSIPAAKELDLPNPLPFVGVSLWKQKVMPYKSRVDPEILVSNAAKELGAVPAMAEPWKIFLLALCCGLRKSEIDYLEWRQVDLKAGEILIEKTAYFRPKSDDSEGLVDMDEGVVAVLRAAKERATGAFVIESTLLPKGPGTHPRYRAGPHFDTLKAWLKGQGITARKPLHELRKEAGSMVAKLQGLFAAQTFLRHSTPQITAAYYVSKKERFSTGLGKLLPAAGTMAKPNRKPAGENKS